jgi:hypothetical protein
MRILVDGDACPVKEDIVAIACPRGIEVIFVVSTAGYFDRDWQVKTVMVDSMPQAVDIAIVNRVQPGDIVVTQDYGLASLVLGKRGRAISPRGRRFDEANIDRLLQQRHANAEARKAGVRMKGPRKRSDRDTSRFRHNFQRLLEECLSTAPPKPQPDQ